MPKRKSKYKRQYAKDVYFLAKNGTTVLDICEMWGISTRSFHNWRHEKPEFRKAYEQGLFDYELTNIKKSLRQRAQGFYYTEVTKQPDKKGVLRVTKTVRKYVPPSEAALFFYLTNRDPENWKHRSDLTIGTGKGKGLEIVVTHSKPGKGKDKATDNKD